MRFVAIALAWVLALGGLANAGPSSPGRMPAGPQLAYFQTHTLYRSGLEGTHTVALTFDDGPNFHTPAVLDELKALNIKATFFIVGRMAHAYPNVLARIAAEGHLLANHSASHPFLSRVYDQHPQMLIDQIRDVNDEIAPLMKPGDQLFFRAPYGSWLSAHAAILNADPVLRDYTGPIYWDVGGQISMHDGYVMGAADWECWHLHWDAQTCAKGYLREIRRKNGGIVLMHCIHRQSGELVAAVVPALAEEGYTFVRIDQVNAFKPYETPPNAAPAIAGADGDVPLSALAFIPAAAVK